ncbi:primary amine oxidase-like [Senna tora]|uniref:Amine oxidase n=1 Tax=Senna tora TaxID=362788 RepID=A0A834W371_9FABA|nr:primary amine oxidase-like [Senna tora]
MVSLKPLADCPPNAAFFDAYYAAQDGKPVQISNAICVFQKHAGDIMQDVSLVVRIVSIVGNYDYIIDWEFKPSGSVKLGVGLTRILVIKGTSYTHVDEIKEDDAFGTLLADNNIEWKECRSYGELET